MEEMLEAQRKNHEKQIEGIKEAFTEMIKDTVDFTNKMAEMTETITTMTKAMEKMRTNMMKQGKETTKEENTTPKKQNNNQGTKRGLSPQYKESTDDSRKTDNNRALVSHNGDNTDASKETESRALVFHKGEQEMNDKPDGEEDEQKQKGQEP